MAAPLCPELPSASLLPGSGLPWTAVLALACSLAMPAALPSTARALARDPVLLAQSGSGANQATGAVSGALPPILRSEADLPEPVRVMRQRLIEAARTGDMERLRALMEEQPEAPAVSLGNAGDPIEYLKALATDAEGREVLAILLETLESGFVRVSPGTPDELYVWPYFAQYPPDALTPPQLVELFTLLTAADYDEMRSYGSYTFFRVGIAPNGRWLFFLAGD